MKISQSYLQSPPCSGLVNAIYAAVTSNAGRGAGVELKVSALPLFPVFVHCSLVTEMAAKLLIGGPAAKT